MTEPRTESDSDDSFSDVEEATEDGASQTKGNGPDDRGMAEPRTESDCDDSLSDVEEVTKNIPKKDDRGMAEPRTESDCDDSLSDAEEVTEDGASQTKGESEFQQKYPIKYITESLVLRIKTSSATEVNVSWDQKRCEENAHSSVIYFAFSSPVTIPLTMATLENHKIKTNTDGLEDGFLEFDLCEHKFNQKQDASDFVYTALTEVIIGINSRKLKRKNSRYEAMEKSFLTGRYPALSSGHVMCFRTLNTEDLYLVGYESYLKKMVDELTHPESENRTELPFPKTDWIIPIHLGLEDYLKQEAEVETKSTGEEFIVSYNACEKINVREIMKRFKSKICSKTVNLERKEFERLLIIDGHSKNQNVEAYIENQIRLKHIKAFINIRKQKKRTNLTVHCKDQEDLQIAEETIQNCFQTLTLSKMEINERLTCDLNEWTTQKKIIPLEKKDETVVFCTTDVFNIIQMSINIEEKITLPPLAVSFLLRPGRDIIPALKAEIGLDEASVDEKNLCLHLKGRLHQITSFKEKIVGSYHLEKVPMKASQSILTEAEEILQQIAESLLCTLEVKLSGQHRKQPKSNCPVLVSWSSYRKNMKLSVSKCGMKELQVECKVSFTTDLLCPLERLPFDPNNGEKNPASKELKACRYTLGERIWDNSHSILGYKNKNQPTYVKLVAFSNSVPNASSKNPDDFLMKNIQHMFKEAFNSSLKSIAIPLNLQNDTFKPQQIATACLEAAFTIPSQEFVEIVLQTSEDGNVGEVINSIDLFCQKQKEVIYRESFGCDLPEITGNEKLTVQVDIESIISVKADVLVNTVGSSFDLDNGPLSRQIAKAAGESVRVECKGVQKHEGEMHITRAGELSKAPTCVEYIFHCVLPKFKKNTIEEDVKRMVKKCLLEVDKRGLKSIVFPAFGTGKLGYPVRDTAQAMFDAVEEYKQCAMNSKIERVVFAVLETDKDPLEAFTHEKKKRKETSEFYRGRIGGYKGFYTDVGPSHNTARLQIAVREDIKMLPSSFITVIILEKTKKENIPLKIQYASEDPSTERDLLRVYTKVDTLQKDLAKAFEFLYQLRVTDIVIYTMKGYNETDQIHVVKEALDEILKTYNPELFRDIIVAVQEIDDQMYDNLMPSQKSGMVHSFTSLFQKTQSWSPCSEEDIPINIQIIGKTKKSCEDVKTKVKNYFRTEAKSTIDIELAKDDTKRTQFDEQENFEKDKDSEASLENGSIDMNTWPVDLVHATVNPGIIRYLYQRNQLETWMEEMQKKFRVKIQQAQTEVTVCGNFGDVLLLESNLENALTDFLHPPFNVKSDEISKQPDGELKNVAEKVEEGHLDFLDFYGLEIRVLFKDITKLNVDCIVSAARETFTFQSGVSKAIQNAAGDSYKKDCEKEPYNFLVVGEIRAMKPGKLPCKMVFHARGPNKSTYKIELDNLSALKDTVKRCLRLADVYGYTSIALSSISAGLGGIDKEKCGQEYFRALVDFLPHRKTLKRVYFVDTDKKWMEQLESILKDQCSRFKNKNKEEFSNALLQQKKHDMATFLFCSIKDKVPVSIEVSSEPIQNLNVVAVVSTEDESFSGKGTIAGTLISLGDGMYKKEQSQLYKMKGRKVVGYMVVTPIRGQTVELEFQHVLHTVFPHVDKHDDIFYSNIRTTVEIILEKAATQNFQSLAMSVIGLECCPDVEACCKATVDAICSYIQTGRKNTKRIVLICVDQAVELEVKDILYRKTLCYPSF